MRQLEDQVRSICFGASAAAAHVSSETVVAEAVPSVEKCMNKSEGEDHAEEEEGEEEEEE